MPVCAVEPFQHDEEDNMYLMDDFKAVLASPASLLSLSLLLLPARAFSCTLVGTCGVQE